MRTALKFLVLVLAVLCRTDLCEARDEAARLARRAELVRELLEEGATAEAISEAATLVAESPASTNALVARPRLSPSITSLTLRTSIPMIPW